MGSIDDHQYQLHRELERFQDGAGVSGNLFSSLCRLWLPLVLAGALAFWWAMQKRYRSWKKLPPGPIQWPLVGCLPAIGFRHRHRTFYELSKKYGPIMHVPMGAANMIVVHGPALAMELLQSQDAQFCSRPLSMTGQYIGFDHHDLNLSPYNGNWKSVRKAFSTELVSPSRLNLQAPMRREEILVMARSILEIAQQEGDQTVSMTKVAEDVVTNIIVRMLFGKRYADRPDMPIARALQNFVPDLREGIFLWGELNLADFFPALARLDLQGLEGRFKRLMEKLGRLFKLIIDEHKEHLEEVGEKLSEEEKDFIDVMLLQKQLTEKQIMGIMSNTLIAGIDTTSRAIEWAMAELVVNPRALEKAQEELDRVVGRERLMNESDLPRLPYLQAIAKEVLRLHPPAPLDDPHLNEQPAALGGYHIPAKSIVLLNLWALGQDPSIWNNPTQFFPDRFLGSHLNVYGNHHSLLPFSSGRRKCPAYQLATIKLQHVLGVLLQAFDWAPPRGMCAGEIDLEEGDGIVIGPKQSVIVSAKPRLGAAVYEQELWPEQAAM